MAADHLIHLFDLKRSVSLQRPTEIIMNLKHLIAPYRPAIALTYGLTFFEKACLLAYPALTGLTVDGMMSHSYTGLILLIGTWLAHMLVAYFRQRYDTRTFTKIYAFVANKVVLTQKERGEELSEIAARVELARDIVDFFEHELPFVVHTILSIIGALVMLYFYDTQAGLIATVVLAPLLIGNAIYARKSKRLNGGLNDQVEREVRTLQSGSPFAIDRHFRLLGRWKVALSDAENTAWVFTEFATLLAVLFILLNFLGAHNASAGTIFAILSYAYDYLDGLDGVPQLINQVVRLNDIQERLA